MWSSGVGEPTHGTCWNLYQAALLEQYNLHVEIPDRVSARRATTNGVFVSLNTLFATRVSFTWTLQRTLVWILVSPLPILRVLSGAWFCQIKSYRRLITPKFTVIGLLEEKLPPSPYARAERTARRSGRHPAPRPAHRKGDARCTRPRP